MTPSYKTSVASVKFLMSQKPKIYIYFIPGSIGLTSSPFSIFFAIISEPASPKPRAKRAPILLRVYSSTTVSIGASFFSSSPPTFRTLESALSWASAKASCSASSSRSSFSSSSCAAFRGSDVIAYTFLIIFSIGVITRSVVSLEKRSAPAANTKETMNVVVIPRAA